QLAQMDIVDGRAWRVAEAHLPEPLRVIGDGGEVEGAVDVPAPGLLLVVVGERDRRAAREGVGVVRQDAGPEDVGVGGEAGMDVEIAEVGGAEEVEAAAGLARLGLLPGRRTRAEAGRGE